ncbi:hypothetical protein [Leptolyngbya sp. CCY15150]|nr:hypothetical protein [Leptolyngbya sp. CCY15150]
MKNKRFSREPVSHQSKKCCMLGFKGLSLRQQAIQVPKAIARF